MSGFLFIWNSELQKYEDFFFTWIYSENWKSRKNLQKWRRPVFVISRSGDLNNVQEAAGMPTDLLA
jgi:hypothetical protein